MLKLISKLEKHQKIELERFIVDSLQINEESKNKKPKLCPFCNQETKMIKKELKERNKDIYVKNVIMYFVMIKIQLP